MNEKSWRKMIQKLLLMSYMLNKMKMYLAKNTNKQILKTRPK